jgi:uncharacterized protein involved in exopolysaccharide biosynthesis
MAIEKSYIDMLKERDAKIEALKELLKLSHESLDSKDKQIAELEGKIFKQSQESKEAVSRAIEIILEKDEKIAELEKEREELIKEFAEAECMGDLAKITRQYGYEALKEQE